jgi:hypothetical protein
LQEVLIKDVLDEWGNSLGQESELVIISPSSLSDNDPKKVTQNNSMEPTIDEILSAEE